jgi:flagellar FliL protein
MAEDNTEEEVKKGKPIVKIILIVVGILVLLGVAVGGTLFATGFFDPKAEDAAKAKLEQLEGEAAAAGGAAGGAADGKAEIGPDGKPIEPKRVTKSTPDAEKFEYTYKEIERELLANLTNSRKVMQVQIAFMTRYDERVFKNVEKHEFAVRSVTLDLMRQVTEADLEKPDFRKELAEKIREGVNAKLESLEDFGGIEEVYFTSFGIQ